eukprot:2672523-Lingulodinium_polyedra.AAC.1
MPRHQQPHGLAEAAPPPRRRHHQSKEELRYSICSTSLSQLVLALAHAEPVAQLERSCPDASVVSRVAARPDQLGRDL